MEKNTSLELFDGQLIRVEWDSEKEKYWFSVVDVIAVLNDSDYQTARKYWKVLKGRLVKEGFEVVTNCYQLKLVSPDGKKRLTDVADLEQLFRIIQTIPSKKAEPVKRWLADVGHQRVDQMIDPELTFQMAVDDYRRLGYSEKWIENRLKSIRTRNELTNEWKRSGVTETKDFAILTNILTKAWSGMTTGEYKQFKGLTKESLRDNMTNLELALNTLAEAATTEISKHRNPKTMGENRQVAQNGGHAAKIARLDIEKQIKRSVISSQRASEHFDIDGDVETKSLPEKK